MLLLTVHSAAATNTDSIVSFSTLGGFYDTSFSLSLTCPQGLSIHYTTNGNTPTSNDALYGEPLFLDNELYSKSNIYTIQTCPDENWFVPDAIQRCIVIRAAVFDSEGNRVGPVVTNSYFIQTLEAYPANLPVVSLCADSSALFGHEEGILLQKGAHANCFKRGKEWERLCNMEFYEHDNSGINQQAGLRMHGNSARQGLQKGMKVYARKEYGHKRFCHKFFNTTENHCFKHLVLKPLKGGIGLKDHISNQIAYSINVETMASRPVILYLNGEYWGIYFLKEKPDAHFISDHYGYDDDDVNVIESWYGHVADGNNENFVAMMRWLMKADMSDEETYKQACQMIDMDNFIDYYSYCMFVGISDWPDMNMRCWQAGNGKWRWIFYDGDGGFGATPNMVRIATYTGDNALAPVLLFTKLFANDDFRNRFYCRYGHLLTHEFGSENTLAILESCMAPFNDESIENAHFARFGYTTPEYKFENLSVSISNFLKYRIVNAAGMMFSWYYRNGWEYHLSAHPKHTKFKHKPKSKRPTYLLKMWKQFDDFRYVKAYLNNEPHRIKENMKGTKLYRYLKKRIKPSSPVH